MGRTGMAPKDAILLAVAAEPMAPSSVEAVEKSEYILPTTARGRGKGEEAVSGPENLTPFLVAAVGTHLWPLSTVWWHQQLCRT